MAFIDIKVTCHYNLFDGTVEMHDNNFGSSKIAFVATVNSIIARNEKHDTHLNISIVFDANNYP